MKIRLILKWKNQEIGIGCGRHFIFTKKHYGYVIAIIKILPKFLSAMLKTIFLKLLQIMKKKIFIIVDLKEY